MRILITGSAGYIGSKSVELLKEHGYEIYGIDVRKPKNIESYTKFVEGSVSDKASMEDIFNEARPDVAINLAFIVDVTHDIKKEEDVALGGAHNFLKLCEKFKVPRVVYVSSVASYGAHDHNISLIDEGAPLRGVKGYSYSRLKELADKMAQKFMAEHTRCQTVILRPCLVVGPNTDNHFFDILKWPIVPQIWDKKGVRDPEFQFIHEDDMVSCLVATAEKPVSGIFNVAATGTQRYSELIKRAGKLKMPLPYFVVYPIAFLLWHLRVMSSPPAQLNFIRFPWIMDVSKMQQELYTPTKTSEEAFGEFIEGQKR
ncbi:MAG: NAD-dependent epimerase/dehydratase family protein [Pseudomonadota bacterium]